MPRRTRYTVYAENTEPLVYLGYGEAGVRAAHGVIHGEKYPITRVVLGDYRTASLRGESPWRVDPDALNDALALLGIVLPVSVRINGRSGSTLGTHRFNGERHDIMLKSYLSPSTASETLWHELCHAVQAERAGSLHAWNRMRASMRGTPYNRKPVEVEANELAETMSDVPLTVAL